ncbi:MAG: UDP-3-O-[3-hydroxymyristoyl] N-acetylglucosamine deacetylase [Candidatus Omnitrophica bacterium]|nr:UDP-3-O-[3-hydroxymyristoyl] N-acetylglucosamine deacetylase [Candidatus Omnitrophota bacterium]
MVSRQKTIIRQGSLEGVGLHTGARVKVTLRPAPAGHGIRFSQVPGSSETNGRAPAAPAEESLRCTSIVSEELNIKTVEHLLAALFGLGISNLRIEVDGPEIPGMDGSALPFVKWIKNLGIVEQAETRETFQIQSPIFCHEPGKALAIYPAGEFSVAYTLDYPMASLRDQKVDFTLTPETFESQIAPARTFCTDEEARVLQKQGFGLGATHENTLVISEKGVVQNTLRFPDECARHKVLDILGDMNLLEFSVAGRVVGLRSGHSLNRALIEAIQKQRKELQMAHSRPKSALMDSEAIMKILPHRHPFLMVDRILEMNDHFIVGVKDVRADEPHFKGHFPGKPIMPGVLMIEALAQTGGVLILSKPENRGKMAYLVSVNSARFRKMVRPGDALRLEVEILKVKSRVGLIKGVAKVNGEEVCDAEIMFSMGGE